MNIAVQVAAGLLLALFFYGGLWLTVRELPHSRHPAWLVLGSFLIRSALVIYILLLLTQQRWDYMLACMLGFIAGRPIVSKYLTARGTAA